MKNLAIIFLTLFTVINVRAQYSAFKTRADNAFKNKDYYEAAYYYKKVIDGKKSLNANNPFYASAVATKKQVQHDRTFCIIG